MKFETYISDRQNPSNPRDARAERTNRRLVWRLEGYLGHELNLPKKTWPKLIERLRGFTRFDWMAVRQHGEASIPELKKKGHKSSKKQASTTT